MWQPSLQTQESSNSRYEIHVLVVDHERDYRAYMANQLKSCSYKVTTVETGRDAMSMLTNGQHQFDLLLADTNLPDLDVFKLLQLAVHCELPSILMSDEYDKLVAELAVSNGAVLLLQKPFTEETTRNFWQYVMKERTPKLNTLVPLEIIAAILEEHRIYIASHIQVASRENATQNDNRRLNGVIPKRTPRKKSKKCEECDAQENCSRPNRLKRKACTDWTVELHTRFVNAVNQLGDGRCYPKEILDLMNVPGLTRMQVASHLQSTNISYVHSLLPFVAFGISIYLLLDAMKELGQKCRNDDWRAPQFRKSTYPYSNGMAPTLSLPKENIANSRKFGAMPHVPKKRNIGDTFGGEMNASSGDVIQIQPNPSTLENQNFEQGIQVTLPLSQPPNTTLPLSFDNADPMVFIPTPTMQVNVDGAFGGHNVFDNTLAIPTTDIQSSDFGVNTNSVTQPQQEFGTSMDMSSLNQGFDLSAVPDLNLYGDFVPNVIDGFVNNINGLPMPHPMSTAYQQVYNDFTNLLHDQNVLPTNINTSGPWNNGMPNNFNQP